MPKKKTLPRLIEDAIDKGATTVEEIHKSIADLPLKMLEGSDLLRGPSKEVRRIQDHTIAAVYDVIRKVNEQVGTLASDLLAEAAARRAVRLDKAHKRVSAAGHAVKSLASDLSAKASTRRTARSGKAHKRASAAGRARKH